MPKKILIDAGQEQEIRVALVDENNRIEDIDFEVQDGNKQLKGNVYVAKVLRVEASLQAVFVDYGNERQGFLSFQEIHPDYFNIPEPKKQDVFEVLFDTASLGAAPVDPKPVKKQNLHRKYNIQQVIRPKQTMLVQVVKEERGNKCAALTTYISLIGRYCVLMPNTPGKVGISKKIQGAEARDKLKEVVSELGVDDNMSVVIRTVGEGRSKTEIEKDYEYLLKIWQKISDDSKNASVPALLYEESCLIKRTIRDMYTDAVSDVVVEGEDAYKVAKDFMRSIDPTHVKNVKQFHGKGSSGLFQHYKIEEKLDTIYSPRVDLPSGGYIVINHTEALIAIDINSGKSTKERNIEETAFRTNIEAAEEISRQMIIRNLSGIIIVDFIDMENHHNREKLEHAMLECLKKDKARTQVSKISKLGLMEISRQMLKPSIVQSKSGLCPHCGGLGYLQTSDTVGLRVIRALQSEIIEGVISIEVRTTQPVAMNVLNNHRSMLAKIEKDYNVKVMVSVDNEMNDCKFEFHKIFKVEEENQQWNGDEKPETDAVGVEKAAVVEDKKPHGNSSTQRTQNGLPNTNNNGNNTNKLKGGKNERARNSNDNKQFEKPLDAVTTGKVDKPVSQKPGVQNANKHPNPAENPIKVNRPQKKNFRVIDLTSDTDEPPVFVYDEPVTQEAKEVSTPITTKRRRRGKKNAQIPIVQNLPNVIVAAETEKPQASSDVATFTADTVQSKPSTKSDTDVHSDTRTKETGTKPPARRKAVNGKRKTKTEIEESAGDSKLGVTAPGGDVEAEVTPKAKPVAAKPKAKSRSTKAKTDAQSPASPVVQIPETPAVAPVSDTKNPNTKNQRSRSKPAGKEKNNLQSEERTRRGWLKL